MFGENDVIGGRYRLLRQIGAGGMGVVWEAQDEQLGRSVAVKVIIPKLARDKKKLARFETGAKAVATLSSPHIVQLLEYGVDKSPYMVMELLHGVVLSERLQSGRRFELDVAVRIIAQTAKALTAAHDEGVVHRNLKPSNIFLVEDGDDEYVKVFDFGTAKWLTGFRNANDITTMGSIMGSPDYLAPEQLSGDARSDHRADVWSLAAIAYHLITGVTPFEGEQMGALMRNILFTDPEPPTAVDPNIPGALDEVFARALSKKRDERYQSARELADDICDATGNSGATMRISIRSKGSGTPDIGDIDSAELPDTKADAPAPLSGRGLDPSTGGESSRDSSRADSEGESRASPPPLDTPARAALVAPPLTPPTSDLPSLPVLVLGAALFLGIGGAAAWFVMAPEPPTPAQETTAPPDEEETAPEEASSAPPEPSAEPSASATASASTAPAKRPLPTASTAPNPSSPPTGVVPRPRWPPPRPDPGDIYDD